MTAFQLERFSRRSRRTATGLTVAILILLGGAAAAYWSMIGSSLGSAATGALEPLTLSAGVAANDLRPGGSTAVSFVASNPNATAVTIGSFSLDTSRGNNGLAVDAAHSGCSLASLSFSAPVNGAGWTVPGRQGVNDGSLSVSLADALSMHAGAASACQGATFTVFLAAGS